MNFYFEKLTLFRLINLVIKKKDSFFKKKESQEIYYVDISLILSLLLPIFHKFSTKSIKRLDFQMTDIVDDKGELVKIRIARKDLFKYKDTIVSSSAFKEIVSSIKAENRLKNFLSKQLLDGNASFENSITRFLFTLEVIKWHLESLERSSAIYFINMRGWQDTLNQFANEKNIRLVFQRNFLISFVQTINIIKYLKGIPIAYLLLKNIKYSELSNIFKTTKRQDNQMLFLEGRGDINTQNNGENSDFFWQMNSKFQKKNIVYIYQDKEEKEKLSQFGVRPISGATRINFSYPSNSKDSSLKKKKHIYENKEINNLLNQYNSSYHYWLSLFKEHKVKIFLSWYKYDANHMAIADAINSIGGVAAIWQIAFDGYTNFENQINADILFSYSNFATEIDNQLGSKYQYIIINGYPREYLNSNLKKKAHEIRNSLLTNGAKNIVCVFDENSLDDSRWHTGHELQRENYSYILEELLSNKELGVIFKPKSSKTLPKRLGEVYSLLKDAEKTGRCFIFDQSGRYTTSAPPILASLASDIAIHGHFCAGTAGVESAIAGIPTLLIDREGAPISKLNELPRGRVVFSDWPETIEGLREYFTSDKKLLGFGDWSSIIDDLDPFRDGQGAQRMGDFLHSVILGFQDGLKSEEATLRAVEIYSKKWGSDKIIKR